MAEVPTKRLKAIKHVANILICFSLKSFVPTRLAKEAQTRAKPRADQLGPKPFSAG
jgi:hypothetical protein